MLKRARKAVEWQRRKQRDCRHNKRRAPKAIAPKIKVASGDSPVVDSSTISVPSTSPLEAETEAASSVLMKTSAVM